MIWALKKCEAVQGGYSGVLFQRVVGKTNLFNEVEIRKTMQTFRRRSFETEDLVSGRL